MKKNIVMYVLPVEDYDKEDASNLSVDTLDVSEGVLKYQLGEFTEACNSEELNLVHYWVTYREV